MKTDSGSMVAAIFGRLDVRGSIDLDALGEDAYSLFAARAESMGWAAPAAGGPGGLWGMNDAGQDWSGGSAQVAWFQVAPTAPASPLPVQPFLACAGDSVARVGRLRLDAVELLLPVQAGTPSVGRLRAGANWFAAAGPADRVAVRMTVDGGEGGEVVQDAAARLLAALREPVAAGFVFEDVTVDPRAAVEPRPPVPGRWWLGDRHRPATFGAVLAEWSPDAIGWAAELVVARLHETGMATTVALGIERAAVD